MNGTVNHELSDRAMFRRLMDMFHLISAPWRGTKRTHELGGFDPSLEQCVNDYFRGTRDFRPVSTPTPDVTVPGLFQATKHSFPVREQSVGRKEECLYAGRCRSGQTY